MKALTPKQQEFLARCIGQAHAAIAGAQYDAGIAWCRKALERAPDLPEAWYNLGLAYAGQGQAKEATDALLKTAALVPDNPDAQNSIGLQLIRVGANEEAERCLMRCLALAPDFAFAHSNLGLLRKKQNRLGEAAAAFRKAVDLQPLLAAAHANLGGTLNLQKNFTAGEAACRRALEIDPALPEAWSNLGNALLGLDRTDEAEAASRKALALDPALPEPHVDLAAILVARGAFAEAIGEFDRALAKDPHNCETISSRLFCLNYVPQSSPAAMLAAARAFDEVASRNVVPFTSWNCVPDPGRKLRIGLVSGDLRRHPVGYLLQGPLRELDRAAFDVVAYSNHSHRDDLTAELESRCAAWNDVVAMSDAELARRIHADGIDILVDLSGHTGHGRLPVFARKPAPVQVTWLGYFATTGPRGHRLEDRGSVGNPRAGGRPFHGKDLAPSRQLLLLLAASRRAGRRRAALQGERIRHLRMLQQSRQDQRCGHRRVVAHPARRRNEQALPQVEAIGRQGPARDGGDPVRPPRHPGGPPRSRGARFLRRLPRGVWPRGHLPRPVPVSGRRHDGGKPLDGRARRDPRGGPLHLAPGREPAPCRGAARVDRTKREGLCRHGAWLPRPPGMRWRRREPACVPGSASRPCSTPRDSPATWRARGVACGASGAAPIARGPGVRGTRPPRPRRSACPRPSSARPATPSRFHGPASAGPRGNRRSRRTCSPRTGRAAPRRRGSSA